jgi:uncharacterized protein YehS (DUF1456 family)
MQKRKIPKNTLPDEFIQDAISGMIMEEVGITPESVTGMVSAICNNSIELSKVVIENRVRNSDKLNNTDIYNIYKESSIVVAQAVELQGK